MTKAPMGPTTDLPMPSVNSTSTVRIDMITMKATKQLYPCG